MPALEMNKVAKLGGDKLLDVSCIRTATDLNTENREEENEKIESRVQHDICSHQ